MPLELADLADVIADVVRAEVKPLRAQLALTEQRAEETISTLRSELAAVKALGREERIIEKGLPGERGEPGPQGPKGETGLIGSSGDPGPAGERGDIGPQGPAGATGPQGERGEPGPAGPIGSQGPQGPQGEKGLDGIGRDGRDGLPGVPGQHGEKGLDGTNGRDGIDGKDGKDGLGFKHFGLDFDGEQTFIFKLEGEDGEIKEFPVRTSIPFFKGTWDTSVEYQIGHEVAWDGACWRALLPSRGVNPSISTGNARKFWALVAMRGKQGKSGERGEKGDPGIRGPEGPRGPQGY